VFAFTVFYSRPVLSARAEYPTQDIRLIEPTLPRFNDVMSRKLIDVIAQ
jgi:hypothetical protein